MTDGSPRPVSLLAELRTKFGGGIVDELIRGGRLTKIPLSDSARSSAEGMLDWEPSTRPPFDGMLPTAARLHETQLLSDDLPSPIAELSTALHEAAREMRGHDDAHASLLTLAARAYPALLSWASYKNIETDTPHGPMSIEGTSELVLATERLSAEFPFCTRNGRPSRDVRTTFGEMRYGLVLPQLASLVVNGAWRLCLLRGAWLPTDLASAIAEQLQRVRDAQAGRPALVPIFCGIGNLQLDDAVEFDGVVIRPYIGGFQNSIIHPSSRFLRTKGVEAGAIMELQYPWEFSCPLSEPGENEPEPARSALTPPDWSELRRWMDCFAVATAAANVDDLLSPEQLRQPLQLPPAPLVRWVYPADPLCIQTSSHFSTPWPAGSLTPTIDDKTLSWLNAFLRIDNGPFKVAIRRIGASLTVPKLLEDALVDAVIAWEALSGDNRQAVKKMVAAVLAKLTAQSRHRREVRKIIEKVYGVRNRIVHGAAVDDFDDVEKAKHRAILVAVVAAKQLAKNHTELIGKKDVFDVLCLD